MIEVVIPEDEITYTLEAEEELEPYEGNCSASGSDEEDREAEEWIRKELDRGNDWAWCSAKVTAEWRGFRGEDYLGMCSYRSEEDFRDNGMYEDMKTEAREALTREVQRTLHRILAPTAA